MTNINLNYEEVQKRIGIEFRNRDLILTAFTHRSYLNEHKSVKEHNERLEFLGDAVLELVTTKFLYENYKEPEGVLTNWRSALVKTETISDVAFALGFDDFILLSRGERKSTGKARQLILANSFEAVLGAIYLDQGYEKAGAFVEKYLLYKLPEIIETKAYIDGKSQLQELAQEKEGITPHYVVLKEEGPDHEKVFTVGAYVGENIWGKGKGASKQQAEQAAAKKALDKYQK